MNIAMFQKIILIAILIVNKKIYLNHLNSGKRDKGYNFWTSQK